LELIEIEEELSGDEEVPDEQQVTNENTENQGEKSTQEVQPQQEQCQTIIALAPLCQNEELEKDAEFVDKLNLLLHEGQLHLD